MATLSLVLTNGDKVCEYVEMIQYSYVFYGGEIVWFNFRPQVAEMCVIIKL
jgi:hypothetical protein